MNFDQRADEIILTNRKNHARRMETLDNLVRDFDESYFTVVLTQICDNAGSGSGLIYEYYVQKISAAIDHYVSGLRPDTAKEVLDLAKRDFGYCTQDELNTDQEWYEENDCCTHGIELGCCPAGCGS